MILALAILALLLCERLVELALHRRHMRALAARGAVVTRDDGFGLILAFQTVLLAGVAAETQFAPWAAVGWWTWPALAALVAAQALRYWAILTLRERWTIRVVTIPGAPRIVAGPYRWMRHPNYAAVALEALALPLAFRAWATLAAASTLGAFALARRVRREERALASSERGMP